MKVENTLVNDFSLVSFFFRCAPLGSSPNLRGCDRPCHCCQKEMSAAKEVRFSSGPTINPKMEKLLNLHKQMENVLNNKSLDLDSRFLLYADILRRYALYKNDVLTNIPRGEDYEVRKRKEEKREEQEEEDEEEEEDDDDDEEEEEEEEARSTKRKLTTRQLTHRKQLEEHLKQRMHRNKHGQYGSSKISAANFNAILDVLVDGLTYKEKQLHQPGLKEALRNLKGKRNLILNKHVLRAYPSTKM